MDLKEQYFIVAGTVRGALAKTKCKRGEVAEYELGTGEAISEITALQWGQAKDEIIVGYKTGLLKLYNCLQNKYTESIDDLPGEGAVVGVAPLNNNIIVGRFNGVIDIWTKKDTDSIQLNLQEESTLECMALNQARINILGTGGIKNDFKLWNLETKQCFFKAKSLGHDYLNLPIPTSIRSICYFPMEEKISVCATKEGYALLYDERAQRRPVSKFIEPKASYTVISTTFKERQCLVGTTKGYIQLLDLRNPSECLKTFKSFTGSVTDIVCDSENSHVISTSLDRFLRIHNLKTKELVHKEYLKQSLTKVLVRPKVKEEDDEEISTETLVDNDEDEQVKEEVEEIDEEYEELFRSMETVSEKVQKQKRKSENDVQKKKKMKR